MCIYQMFKNDIKKYVQILYVDLPKVGSKKKCNNKNYIVRLINSTCHPKTKQICNLLKKGLNENSPANLLKKVLNEN